MVNIMGSLSNPPDQISALNMCFAARADMRCSSAPDTADQIGLHAPDVLQDHRLAAVTYLHMITLTDTHSQKRLLMFLICC